LLTEIVDQILMPFIQPVRLPACTGRPDVARPAARFPAPAQDAIGDRLATTEQQN
jgi:hypothetical protein